MLRIDFAKLYSIIIVKGDEFMKFKRKQMLSIVLLLILLVPYFGFIRDWSKPSFIEEHWIECTVDKINSYTDLSEIYNDLVKDGAFVLPATLKRVFIFSYT